MTANQAAASSIRASNMLMGRFCEDLTPAEMLHRPVKGSNCAAWTLGHLTLASRMMAMGFGMPPEQLPALPDGFEKRFSREPGVPEAAEFGDCSHLLATLSAHMNAFAAYVESAPPEVMDQPLPKPHPMFKSRGEMAVFCGLHTMMHAGQISTIRRSLGRPPII